jgi:hypothetical protein
VVSAAVPEEGQGAADDALRPVHDLCHGDGLAGQYLFQGGDEVGLVGGADPLDQDLQFAATGQAHGEGIVVGVAERGPDGGSARFQHLLAQVVDGAFDASSGDAADRFAIGVDGQ